jgi:2-polyprenyl-3-methyl-5-hydroxy-6-metoxy-1,4-benzoquinol methylase
MTWESSEQHRLERCPCPLCGAAPPERAREEFPPYRVVDCPSCGLRFLSPRVAAEEAARLYEGERYFEDGGLSGGYASYAAMEPLLVRTFVRRLKLLSRPRPGARLLDVGCGPGAGLAAARALGWEPFGLDPSAAAVAAASTRFPERVRLGSLSDRLFQPHTFDVITLFDVVEHLYDPRRLAHDLDAHLSPAGRLLITTPNCESLLSRLTGRRWVSYKIPEHVIFYSPRTLREALRPLFELERVRACGQLASLDFLFERAAAALPAGGGVLRRLAGIPAARRVTLYANSGSMLAVGRRLPGGRAAA